MSNEHVQNHSGTVRGFYSLLSEAFGFGLVHKKMFDTLQLSYRAIVIRLLSHQSKCVQCLDCGCKLIESLDLNNLK